MKMMSKKQPNPNPAKPNINTFSSVTKNKLNHHPAKKSRIGRTAPIITLIKIDSNLLNIPPPICLGMKGYDRDQFYGHTSMTGISSMANYSHKTILKQSATPI